MRSCALLSKEMVGRRDALDILYDSYGSFLGKRYGVEYSYRTRLAEGMCDVVAISRMDAGVGNSYYGGREAHIRTD